MTHEEEQHQDVYAGFGATSARASAFESNLTNILLLEARLGGRAPTAEDLDKIEEELQKKKATLGNLIKAVKEAVKLPDLAVEIMSLALDRRNYLIHRFFREKAFEFTTEAGCERMTKELLEIEATILAADRKVGETGMKLAERLGISLEDIEAEAEQLRKSIQ